MTSRRHLLICTILICLVTSCGTPLPATPPPATSLLATPLPATPGAPSILPNELVMVEGQVTVKRRETTGFVPAGVGTQVEPGDLAPRRGGRGCHLLRQRDTMGQQPSRSDWRREPWRPVPGRSFAGLFLACHGSASCRVAARPAPRGEHSLRSRPRSSFVRSDRPMLHWHTLSNTGVYTVTLTGDELERPSVQASGRSVVATRTPGHRWRAEAQATAWWFKQASAVQRRRVPAPRSGDSLARSGPGCPITEPGGEAPRTSTWRGRLDAVAGRLYLSNAYRLRSEAAELLSGATVENLAAAQVLLGELYLEMGLVDNFQAALIKH